MESHPEEQIICCIILVAIQNYGVILLVNKYTYEESVRWLREQPEYSKVIEFSYLDEDNLAAAKRFSTSEEFAEIVKLLKLDKLSKLKILDLGCGNGIASYAFASLGHNVYAVDPDISEDVGLGATSRLASTVNNGSISTFQADAESLPFLDSIFDIVYVRQSLHHFANLHKGLTECSRVLKSKGFILATREHVVYDEQHLKSFLENHVLHKLHGEENAYLLKDYISALRQASFKVIKSFGPFDTVINHFPISNLEFKFKLFHALESKVGHVAASVLKEIPLVEKSYKYYLSRKYELDRLYSFLGTKEEK